MVVITGGVSSHLSFLLLWSFTSFELRKLTLPVSFFSCADQSGKLGRATVAHFVAQTPRIYVISLDLFPPPKHVVQPDAFVTVDLTDSGKLVFDSLLLHRDRELTRLATGAAGKVLEALLEVDLKYKLDPKGQQALSFLDFLSFFFFSKLTLNLCSAKGTNQIGIVHLAALPTPGQAVNSVMFQTNVMCTYNILEAARKLGFTNVTLASSVTLAGLPFEPRPMDKLPISEDSQPPYPSHAYSLSKVSLFLSLSEKPQRRKVVRSIERSRFADCSLTAPFAFVLRGLS